MEKMSIFLKIDVAARWWSRFENFLYKLLDIIIFDQTKFKVIVFIGQGGHISIFHGFFLPFDRLRIIKNIVALASRYGAFEYPEWKRIKFAFQKWKILGGGWGSEQGQISLWSLRCSKFPILSIFWVWHVINLKFSLEFKNIWVYIPNSCCF